MDTEVDLITELAAPVVGINNLFLLKLDNDDLYLINPDNAEVIWKSESQNIPLRTQLGCELIILLMIQY